MNNINITRTHSFRIQYPFEVRMLQNEMIRYKADKLIAVRVQETADMFSKMRIFVFKKDIQMYSV